MVNWSKKIQLQNGRKARLIGLYKPTRDETRYIVAWEGDDGTEEARVYLDTGVWSMLNLDVGASHPYNIINTPEKMHGFINVYNSAIHPTKAEADNCATFPRVACIDLSQFNVGHGK